MDAYESYLIETKFYGDTAVHHFLIDYHKPMTIEEFICAAAEKHSDKHLEFRTNYITNATADNGIVTFWYPMFDKFLQTKIHRCEAYGTSEQIEYQMTVNFVPTKGEESE